MVFNPDGPEGGWDSWNASQKEMRSPLEKDKKIKETTVTETGTEDELDLKKIAELASKLRGREVKPMDILHQRGIEEDKEREEFKKEKWELIRKIGYEGDNDAFKNAPDKLKADPDVVLKAVWHDGNAFKYAPSELKANKEFVLEAVKHTQNDDAVLEHCPTQFLSDKEFMLKVTKERPWSFRRVSEELRADRVFVLEVLKAHRVMNVQILDYCPKLQADKEVVLEAVKRNPTNFSYASPELRANSDFILEVAKENPETIAYCDEELWKKIKAFL